MNDNIVRSQRSIFLVTVNNLGCWYDARGDRAIKGDYGDLGVRGCYELSRDFNYSIFGVSDGLHCYTSSTAGSTYKKYGQQVKGGLCYRRNVEVYEIRNKGKWNFQKLIAQGPREIYASIPITYSIYFYRFRK